MKKKGRLILFLLLIIAAVCVFVFASHSSPKDITIKLEQENKDDVLLLHVKLDKLQNVETGISGFAASIEYDRNVFQTITEKDIVYQGAWTDVLYNPNNGKLMVLRDGYTNEGNQNIVDIELHKKEGVDISKTKIQLSKVQFADASKKIDIGNDEITIRFFDITFWSIFVNILIVLGILLALLFVLIVIIQIVKKRRKC